MVNYQYFVDFMTAMMYVATPIGIIMFVVKKSTNFFFGLINGDRRVKL